MVQSVNELVIVIVIMIVVFLGQFCPGGKGAMRLILYEVPTCETNLRRLGLPSFWVKKKKPQKEEKPSGPTKLASTPNPPPLAQDLGPPHHMKHIWKISATSVNIRKTYTVTSYYPVITVVGKVR